MNPTFSSYFGVHCKLNSVIIHRPMTDKIIKNQLIIPETYAGQRIDQVLAKLLPEYSRTQLKTWIDQGNILLDQQPIKAKLKVKGGETIDLQAQAKTLPPSWQAQDIPLSIVYEDESLIIINKPVGLVVHPGAGNADKTMLNALLHHAPELNLLPRAGILHRLDKDTSGLLVVAKTATALKNLSYQLKKRSIEREYQAIVYGSMISGGTIDAPIDRHPLQRKRMAVIDTGREAITHYRIAEKYKAHTRLKLKLETGRTHQIRVHLAYIHYPIVGDSVYAGRPQFNKGMSDELRLAIKQFKRQALHAFALGFTHPETQEWMRFEIELPQDMQDLIQILRQDKDSEA